MDYAKKQRPDIVSTTLYATLLGMGAGYGHLLSSQGYDVAGMILNYSPSIFMSIKIANDIVNEKPVKERVRGTAKTILYGGLGAFLGFNSVIASYQKNSLEEASDGNHIVYEVRNENSSGQLEEML